LSNKADGTTDDCTASSFEESDDDTDIEDWNFDDEEQHPPEHYLNAAANQKAMVKTLPYKLAYKSPLCGPCETNDPL
jgi:hypothetical protein